ncbi:MAG: hypothetical protein ACI4J1_07320 [Ruminiclostridium sp.]
MTAVSKSGNCLVSLDLGRNEYASVECSDNRYPLSSLSMDELLPLGFRPEKASNWQGADYDPETNSLVNVTSKNVTYDYDIGQGKIVSFTLVVPAEK